MARKKEFKTEMLKEIIDRFFSENKVFGQVTPTEIAKYADKSLKYEKIRYYHFTRDEEAMRYIDEINHAHSLGIAEGNQTVVEFNPDKFMETYGNNKKIQMIVLRQFADRHNTLNKTVVDLRYAEVEYKKHIEELLSENRKLKDANRKLRSDNEKKSLAIKRLNRFKELENQVNMREFLASKSLFNKMDDENLNLILTKCGFNGEGYTDIKYEDSEELQFTDENDVYVVDDTLDLYDNTVIEEDSHRIISLDGKKRKKALDEEVNKLLKDVDDLV